MSGLGTTTIRYGGEVIEVPALPTPVPSRLLPSAPATSANDKTPGASAKAHRGSELQPERYRMDNPTTASSEVTEYGVAIFMADDVIWTFGTPARARAALAKWSADLDAAEGVEPAAPATGWVEINAAQLRPSTAERNGDTLTDGRRILTLRTAQVVGGARVMGQCITDTTGRRGRFSFGSSDRVQVLTPRPETDLAEFSQRAVNTVASVLGVDPVHTAEHADGAA